MKGDWKINTEIGQYIIIDGTPILPIEVKTKQGTFYIANFKAYIKERKNFISKYFEAQNLNYGEFDSSIREHFFRMATVLKFSEMELY